MIQNKKPPAISANLRTNAGSNVSPFATRKAMPLPSPFAKTQRAEPDPETLADDAAYYQLNATAPSLVAADLETAARAVEVQVLWGEYDAIHLSVLNPPRSFVIGESGADFAMESAQLGAERYPLTVVEGGVTFVVVPFDAEVTVKNRGVTRKLTALREEGALTATPELAGAMRYRLADEDVMRVRRAGFVFQVKSVAAPKKLAAASRFDFTPAYYMSGAATVIGALMVALALANPSSGTLASNDVDTSSRLVQSLINPVEVEDQSHANASSDSASSDSGRRASEDEGIAGRPNRPNTGRRRMDSGTVRPTSPTTASSTDMVDNNQVLGTIRTLAGSLLAQSDSTYSAATAVGSDPMSQLGAVLGAPGESGGMGGLGMNGHGLGGGNPLNDILFSGGFATHGDRPGNGPGGPGRFGRDVGGDLGPRVGARPDDVRPDGTGTVSGGLAQEVIRRTIQRNIGQVRFCYEQALNANPDLAGRVTVRFMISPTGAVQTAVASSSTVADPRVGTCVAQAMRRLSFPAPEGGGMVSVSYPFVFSSNR